MTVGELIAASFEDVESNREKILEIITGEESSIKAAVLALEINSYLNDEYRRLFKKMLAEKVSNAN